MKTIARTLGAATLAAGLLFGGAAAANAETVKVGGGTWDYGVDKLFTMSTWSNYHHPSRAHGSTACSSSTCKRSATAPAGKWSKAQGRSTWSGNQAYWRL